MTYNVVKFDARNVDVELVTQCATFVPQCYDFASHFACFVG